MHHLRVLRHGADQESGARALQELPDGKGGREPGRDQKQPIEGKRLLHNNDDAAQKIGYAGGARLGAPDHPDDLAQDDSKPEGEQQVSPAVAPAIQMAQEDALERHPQAADDDGRKKERQKKAAGHRDYAEADIRTEHEDGAVRKIDDAHDAKDQGEPAGDEKQDRRLRERAQALRQDKAETHLLKLELRQSGVFISRG